jgi:hypothetical protein
MDGKRLYMAMSEHAMTVVDCLRAGVGMILMD